MVHGVRKWQRKRAREHACQQPCGQQPLYPTVQTSSWKTLYYCTVPWVCFQRIFCFPETPDNHASMIFLTDFLWNRLSVTASQHLCIMLHDLAISCTHVQYIYIYTRVYIYIYIHIYIYIFSYKIQHALNALILLWSGSSGVRQLKHLPTACHTATNQIKRKKRKRETQK